MKIGTTRVLTEKQRDKVLLSCFGNDGRIRDNGKRLVAFQEASKVFNVKLRTVHKGHYDERIELMTNFDNYDEVGDYLRDQNIAFSTVNAKIGFHPNH